MNFTPRYNRNEIILDEKLFEVLKELNDENFTQ